MVHVQVWHVLIFEAEVEVAAVSDRRADGKELCFGGGEIILLDLEEVCESGKNVLKKSEKKN